MRVFAVWESWGVENLNLVERSDPSCGPGQVLIKMKANSLNFRDLLMVRGLYNPNYKLPLVPLSDGVGEVVEVGEGVTRLQVGDRVAGLFVQDWVAGRPDMAMAQTTLGGPLDGMLAELAVLPERGLVKVPEYLTDVEAATLPCAALTAWSALVTYGDVNPGDVVLVQGTGGVSTFALQFAKLLGARVIATSSSDEKLKRAVALGADHTINYQTNENWGAEARKLAGGDGVDHVVEVGGAGTMSQSLKALCPGGTISMIGILSGVTGKLNLTQILMRNIKVQGILVGHRQGFEAMVRALSLHKIKPVIDCTYPFEQSKRAFEHLSTASHQGKVCITY